MPPIETSYLSLDKIKLDPNNYRFRDSPNYHYTDDIDLATPSIQKRIRGLLTGKNNENIKDLLASFKKSGFLPVDQIQVKAVTTEGKENDTVYKVIEGNRRIATLKVLQEDFINGHPIGNLDSNVFENVPVVYYEDEDENHYRVLMGLKHINGNKRWALVNQAQLLKDLSDKGMSETEIVESLGISVTRLRRTLRTLALIELYKKSDFGDQFVADMFNIFDATIQSVNIKEWLGFDDETKTVNNKKNLNRFFSWLSTVEDTVLDSEEEDYENISQVRTPIITTNRHIRELAKLIDDENALKFIEDGHSINDAYLSSEQVGKDLFDTTLNLLEENLNTALQFSSFTSKEHSEKLGKIQNKLKGLIATQGLTEIILPQAVKPQILFNFPNTQHFSQIEIIDYKGLNGLNLDSLNKINIIAGNNNIGKTSLLEAIRLLLAQNDVNDFLSAQRLRGRFFSGKIPPQWVDENFFGDINISSEFGLPKQKASINIKKEQEDSALAADYLNTIFFDGQFLGENHHSHIRLFDNNNSPFELQSKKTAHLCPFAYISPFSGYWNGNLFDAHAIAEQNNHHQQVIKFLKKSIDNNIIDIRLIEKYGLKRFLVQYEDSSLDLSQFGDGLQHIYKTILQFTTTSNGVILIDEIETAVHHSLMLAYSKFIQEMAREFNTQVFITSHSGEYINAFIDNDTFIEDISMYRMEKENEKVICKQLSGIDYFEYSRIMDVDLRGGNDE